MLFPRLARSAAAALCALGCALPAAAAPITYLFSGSGDWLSDASSATFNGSFTYDSAASDGIADPSTAAYAHPDGAGWAITLNVPGGVLTTLDEQFNMLASNNLGGEDRLGARASRSASGESVGLWLIDLLGTLMNDDSLAPLAAGLTLAQFGWSEFYYETASDRLQGRLDSLLCTAGCGNGSGGNPGGGSGGGGGSGSPTEPANPVPEPASVGLVALALAAAAWQRRQTGRARRLRG